MHQILKNLAKFTVKNPKDRLELISDKTLGIFEKVILENSQQTKLYTLSEMLWSLQNLKQKVSPSLREALFTQVMD